MPKNLLIEYMTKRDIPLTVEHYAALNMSDEEDEGERLEELAELVDAGILRSIVPGRKAIN